MAVLAKDYDSWKGSQSIDQGVKDAIIGVNCYYYQRKQCQFYGGPILNAACGPDPARLDQLGAVSMDLHLPSSLKDSDRVPENFQIGSVLEMPFDDGAFKTIVLGEFIEHCKPEIATKAIMECKRVLMDDGHLILTFPLDARPYDEQRLFSDISVPASVDGFVYQDGITPHHQTYWSVPMIDKLLGDVGMVEDSPRYVLFYLFTSPVGGWGMTLRKDG
jgi:SAM-dependent methyltransferase